MSKNKQSKVQATSKVVETAQSLIEKHFGKANPEIRKAIAEFGIKNKVAITCLYHAVCAIFGLQRGTAGTKINTYTNALELKSGLGYVSEATKSKNGQISLSVKDCYSQQRYYGWIYGEKSQVSNLNWVHNLRNLATHEIAQRMGSEVSKDAQFIKSSAFKPVQGEKLSKAILAIADAQKPA